eukprot:scaffold3841_cov412-Prasinococcus_capsulatus_cf.AAC.2
MYNVIGVSLVREVHLTEERQDVMLGVTWRTLGSPSNHWGGLPKSHHQLRSRPAARGCPANTPWGQCRQRAPLLDCRSEPRTR